VSTLICRGLRRSDTLKLTLFCPLPMASPRENAAVGSMGKCKKRKKQTSKKRRKRRRKKKKEKKGESRWEKEIEWCESATPHINPAPSRRTQRSTGTHADSTGDCGDSTGDCGDLYLCLYFRFSPDLNSAQQYTVHNGTRYTSLKRRPFYRDTRGFYRGPRGFYRGLRGFVLVFLFPFLFLRISTVHNGTRYTTLNTERAPSYSVWNHKRTGVIGEQSALNRRLRFFPLHFEPPTVYA